MKVIKRRIVPLAIKLIDSLILYCADFKKVRPIKGMTHYLDPETGDYWLRDLAVKIAESRLRENR